MIDVSRSNLQSIPQVNCVLMQETENTVYEVPISLWVTWKYNTESLYVCHQPYISWCRLQKSADSVIILSCR